MLYPSKFTSPHIYEALILNMEIVICLYNLITFTLHCLNDTFFKLTHKYIFDFVLMFLCSYEKIKVRRTNNFVTYLISHYHH